MAETTKELMLAAARALAASGKIEFTERELCEFMDDHFPHPQNRKWDANLTVISDYSVFADTQEPCSVAGWDPAYPKYFERLRGTSPFRHRLRADDDTPLAKILRQIPAWSERLQQPSHDYEKELNSAHSFVTDLGLTAWTYGKSVGADGEYHQDGGQARAYLESLGFRNALSFPLGDPIRARAIEGFRFWARDVSTAELESKLERALAGQMRVEFRLLVPPETRPSAQRIVDKEEESMPDATHPIYDYFKAQGLSFPDEVVSNYALALKTKPFVILTGISGTGKTKIAQAFAEYMCLGEERVVADLPASSENVFYARPEVFKSRRYLYVDAETRETLEPPERGKSRELSVVAEEGPEETARYLNSDLSDPDASTFRLSFKRDLLGWFKSKADQGGILRFDILDQDHLRVRFESGLRRIVTGDRHAFVAVRPDWTDNRGLLGYHNPLTDRYVPTELLKLMLRAAADPDRAYFAILDEMNLAKVEHYFSDFLSCLETRRWVDGKVRQEPLVLHQEAGPIVFEDFDGRSYDIPPTLAIPLNLYFTGTVNVDESTYMFSPKVLDRANTIEFNQVDLRTYGAATGLDVPEDAEFRLRPGFTLDRVVPATKAAFDQLPATVKSLLADLNGILEPANLHFGFRVANEIALYLGQVGAWIGPASVGRAIDLQILQKVLPKLDPLVKSIL